MTKKIRALQKILVKSINLWAHVGVIDSERILGQYFKLDYTVVIDNKNTAVTDDISFAVDYAKVIARLQEFSLEINCKTIESFSENILDLLESFYGKSQIYICLTKCSPPVYGFNGIVAIERSRN